MEKYDDIKFFKDEPDKLEYAIKITNKKVATSVLIDNILQNNEYKIHPQFNRLKTQLDKVLYNASAFRIHVTYILMTVRSRKQEGSNKQEKDLIKS